MVTKGIGYDINCYLSKGLSPNKEYLKEHLFLGEVLIYTQGSNLNSWEGIDRAALEDSQDVESQDKTWRESVP